MKKLFLFAICALAVAAIGPGLVAQHPETSGSAHVLDGDTIDLGGQHIRLHGIDAPEADQTCLDANRQRYRCGAVATRALAALISSNPVRCVTRDTDRFGRSIAQCFVDGADIGATLVRNGMALAYRQYSQAYIREENRAREARAGIWSGSFDFPWNWRRTR